MGAMAPRRRLVLAVAALLAASLAGCEATRFNERERLDPRTMSFDPHELRSTLRSHVLTPREGAVGGFAGSAGGCGCH